MRIQVTSEDIFKGQFGKDQYRCCTCPVALAISRAIGEKVEVTSGHLHVLTGRMQAFVDIPGKPIRIKLPEFVALKIRELDIDDGPPVTPFEFELDYETSELKNNEQS